MGTTANGLRYPEPTEPLNAGAQNIENLADDLELVLDLGAWTPYFPTMRSYGGNAALGTGVIDARYRKAGRDVTFDFTLTAGVGTTWGTSGGGITGLIPFASRRGFAQLWWSILLNPTAPTVNLAYFARPTTADYYDFQDGAGGGLVGAIAAGTVYGIRGFYESAA